MILDSCISPYIGAEGEVRACGKCAMCRRKKAFEWKVRARHELIETEGNKAIYFTMTYRPEDLRITAKVKEVKKDKLGTIWREDVNKFIDRMKIKYGKFRYMYCAEYGPVTWRPHYHMIIFGIDVNEISREEIEERWKLGHVDKSELYVTDYCIQYVVGYISKKLKNGAKKVNSYKGNNRQEPYMASSPGLGQKWCDKNVEEWSKTLKIGYEGAQVSVPRYYIKRIKNREGIKVDFEVEKIGIGRQLTIKKDRAFIHNPGGKYTQRINEVRLRIKNQEIEEEKNKQSWNTGEYEKYRDKEVEIGMKEELRMISRYGDMIEMSIEEREERFHRVEDSLTQKKTGSVDNKLSLDRATVEDFRKIAGQRALHIKRGTAGPRDMIDIIEENYS